MSKSKLVTIALISVILFSLAGSLVAAQDQYLPPVTTLVSIASDGTFAANEPSIGIAYEIQGNPGGTGNITAYKANGNPQSTASVPEGVSLTKFVVVAFNIYSGNFNQAKVTMTYTDEEVANLQAPYTIYKYVASTNSYVAMPSTVDTDAKTITVTVNSVDDPVFAIGGSSLPEADAPAFSATAYALLAASIVIIVLLVVVSVWYFKKKSR